MNTEAIININQRKRNEEINKNVINMELSTKLLTSGIVYQRPIDSKKVKKIMNRFDIHRFGSIKVSYRDNKYWVFDGQHRLAAIKAINNGNDCVVPCEVHNGLTYEDEAKLFATQYDNSSPVHICYKMKALYESKDEEIFSMINIVENCDLKVSFDRNKKDNKITAVRKLLQIYRELKTEGFQRVLNLIRNTWEGKPSSLEKEILGGVYMFVKTYGKIADDECFIKNLKKIDPIIIKRNGDSDFSAKKDIKYAKQIWDYYNKGLSSRNKLDYKFKG